jgi:superfamily II DNA or RNA helicase
MKELVNRGYLVPVVAYAPSKPDLEGVKVKMGDYDEDQLGEACDKPKLIGDIVEHWHKLAKDRQTIVFAATVAHSNHLADAFRASGVNVAHLDGTTPKDLREEVLRDLKNGNIQVVCNVGILTEGYDNPIVSCIVLARPTKSYGLYKQMAGRAMRPAEGKTDMLLIDHAGAVYDHGMVDDDVNWTLEKGELAYEKKKYEKRTAAPWICDNCFHVNQPSRTGNCEACGLKPVKTQQVAVSEGNLEIVTARKPRKIVDRENKQSVWDQCYFIAVKKGLKLGAAAHIYKQRTGVWPRGFARMPSSKEHWQMPADKYHDMMVQRVYG